MASSSTSYPPPPKRRVPPASQTADKTLYSSSPHLKADEKVRRSKHYTDPAWVTLFILALAFVYWVAPVHKPWTPRRAATPFPHDSYPAPPPSALAKMPWQTTFTLGGRGKGCHLVTDEVMRNVNEGLKGTKIGILHLFIQHTSAGLSINENFDKDVRKDMDMVFDKVVPTNLPYLHTDEGPDDSASHSKATLCGSSITIPITDGRLNLGTWQGVYLCEFRAEKHSRRIVATVTP